MARAQTRQEDERDLLMLERHEKGMSHVRIAAQTGESRHTIGYRINAIIEQDIKHDPDNAVPYWRP